MVGFRRERTIEFTGMHSDVRASPAAVHGDGHGETKNRYRPLSWLHRIMLAVACTFVAVLVAHHPIAGAQQVDGAAAPPPLVVFTPYKAATSSPALSTEGAATLETIRSDPAASEIRIGRSTPAAVLGARALSLALPPAAGAPGSAAGATIVFTGASVEYDEDGLASIYARDEAADSEVSLVVQGPDVLGDIRHGVDLYKVRPLGDGMTAVYQYDTSQLRRHPPDWGEIMNSQDQFIRNQLNRTQDPDEPALDDPEAPGAAADTGDVIDVLIAYTPLARVAAGNIDLFLKFAIDNSNRTYDNTGIAPRLRLVHKYETGYTKSNTHMVEDLNRLTFTSSDRLGNSSPDPAGYMDEVHGRRDRYGADLVALIVGRQTGLVCGIAWVPPYESYPDEDFEFLGFSVVAHNCETTTYHSFAHEIGHNQGANHDPDSAVASAFSYGHGLCNTDGGWNTIMSYSYNDEGICRREIGYFSSPIIRYNGTPTGDAQVRDNRRVLNETAYRVANFRQAARVRPTRTHTLPFVTPASNRTQRSLVRIINRSDQAGRVTIHAIDDTGKRFGPVSLWLMAGQTRHIDSPQLESGRTLSGGIGVGDGEGDWRLELSTTLDITTLAYVRGASGFITTMHDVVRGATMRQHVVSFNKAPVSRGWSRSELRLINPNNSRVDITITAHDDRGDPAADTVSLSLPAGAARRLNSHQFERGGGGFDGRFGSDGYGRWQVFVSATRPIWVMNLMHSPNTGYMTNLSSEREEP